MEMDCSGRNVEGPEPGARRFEFELTHEEIEHVLQALSSVLKGNLMSITDSMASDRPKEVKKAEISWFIENSEWFMGIMKKMGFDPGFEDIIERLRAIHMEAPEGGNDGGS